MISWSSFEIKNESKFETDLISTESEQTLLELAQDSKELQDKIQYFEYKNKSRNWKYYVFSYNAVTWENVGDIRNKYVQQYWWKTEWMLITDETWKELPEYEFSQPKKIYLKVNINNSKPINFTESSESSEAKQLLCRIETKWRTPINIRQIYQDENDMVIEKDKFKFFDEMGNICDDSKNFNPWDVVKIEIKKFDSNNNDETTISVKGQITEKQQNNLGKNTIQTSDNWSNKESNKESNEEWKNNYKEMIEMQKQPITMWNKNRPEISITFDDGYWTDCIKHVLDTLKWSDIKATFFILWDCLRNYPELWKRAAKEWHQICCHTFSHIYLNDSGDITNLTTGLNREVKTHSRENNVKSLLWVDYYNRIKSESWSWFPNAIKSTILLRTEILMWEAQMKKTLWESYLRSLKQNYPFFRFPWWCGAHRPSNIAVLKSLWYLSIWWSEDFYRWSWKNRKHMTVLEIKNMGISNWNIPLFHFKKDDYKYVDAYIENMKKKWKSSKYISRVISKK